MSLYMQSVADQTNHLANAFVRVSVAYGYDVVTFESQRKKMDNLMFSSVFNANWVGIM